jgi:ATP-dependent Clp protease ATP-binding subunit ClpA
MPQLSLFDTPVPSDDRDLSASAPLAARLRPLTLDEYVAALKEQSITFMYDDEATEAIADATDNGRCGARDIRIHIRREVEDPLAEMIVQQGEGSLAVVQLTTDENGALMLLTV